MSNLKWLIRKENFKLIGPLTKVELLSMYHAKSLEQNDELCAGNGFWFYVKEEQILTSELLKDEEKTREVVDEIKIDKTQSQRPFKEHQTSVINLSDYQFEETLKVEQSPLIELSENEHDSKNNVLELDLKEEKIRPTSKITESIDLRKNKKMIAKNIIDDDLHHIRDDKISTEVTRNIQSNEHNNTDEPTEINSTIKKKFTLEMFLKITATIFFLLAILGLLYRTKIIEGLLK